MSNTFFRAGFVPPSYGPASMPQRYRHVSKRPTPVLRLFGVTRRLRGSCWARRETNCRGMKPKMIRHFMPKRFGILSTPWRMSEMSETSCRKFSPRTQASYEVALEIVKQKKTHTIGETLVKPCLLKTVELLLGEASEVKMRWISLSSDALQRRFSGMPEDVKDQVINAMISSRWVNRCY